MPHLLKKDEKVIGGCTFSPPPKAPEGALYEEVDSRVYYETMEKHFPSTPGVMQGPVEHRLKALQKDHAALMGWLETQHGLSKGQLATLIKGGEQK